LAITELVKHLKCRGSEPGKKFDTCSILDPCAGEGAAIKQIAASIGVPDERVYTVELDPNRSEVIKALMPNGHHLGNTSFLGTECTGSSFGLAYLNPPFDQELGGGRREEQAFVQAATPLLVTHGILVLVCPLTAIAGKKPFCTLLDAYYEDIRVYKFPDTSDPVTRRPVRSYREIVVIGKKRKEVLPQNACDRETLHAMQLNWRMYFQIGDLPSLGTPAPAIWGDGYASKELEPDVAVYRVPHSRCPNTFRKGCYTIEELDVLAEASPLNTHFEERPPIELGVAPLALGRGHIGLVLASGQLDGRVSGPYGTHVVRGSSYKVSTLDPSATISTVNPESGAVTTKETFRERMITVIRAAVDYPAPGIFTFSNDEQKAKEDDE